MTDSDIQLIELALAITLPESYKRAVVPFRIPAMVGNTNSQLWDDAQRLIAFNRELRAGSRFRPAWPAHLFAIGDPHGDELIALDTSTPRARFGGSTTAWSAATAVTSHILDSPTG